MELVLPAEYRTFIVLSILSSIAATALAAFVAYLILKWAVRDAIKESGLVDALRRSNVRSREADSRASSLPKMTID